MKVAYFQTTLSTLIDHIITHRLNRHKVLVVLLLSKDEHVNRLLPRDLGRRQAQKNFRLDVVNPVALSLFRLLVVC